PVLTEPKAMREPYSLEALNRKPTEAKPVTANLPEIKPADTKPIDTKPSDEENLNWAWPTQGKIIANFNEATNKGVDIAGSLGQTVSAAASGRVIYVGSDLRGYGKLVIVKHNKTFLSVYAHNNKIVAKEGQTVVAGQKIAEMGNTDANSVKLHFEIRRQGKSVDPAKYLPQN
ncbi:MAG: peptidoglycan DD-metalloendopeptidase family protein, partial [Methylophilaceae bacterium]